jgi:NAD(P)-dependent dehydrogenase (short-subunit alcohol dehydrogenase family)
MIHQVRTRLGPIGILHWNAFMDVEGSLMSMAISDLSQSLAVRVVGYVLTLQQCIADLQAHQGSVLVSSGIMALNAPKIDAFASNCSIGYCGGGTAQNYQSISA